MCLWGFVMSECFVTLRWCPIQIQAKCPFKHHNTIYVNCSWDLNMKPFLEVPVIMEPLLSRWHHISVFLLPPASYYGLKVCMDMPLVFSHCVCVCMCTMCVLCAAATHSGVQAINGALPGSDSLSPARWIEASFRSHDSCRPCLLLGGWNSSLCLSCTFLFLRLHSISQLSLTPFTPSLSTRSATAVSQYPIVIFNLSQFSQTPSLTLSPPPSSSSSLALSQTTVLLIVGLSHVLLPR